MDELEKAQIKDRLLHYMLENMGQILAIVPLYQRILAPDYSVQHLRRLIDEIIAYDDHLISLRGTRPDYALMGLATSREFLDNGGFVALYERQQAQRKKQLQEQEEEAKDLIVQRQKNKDEATLARWQVKTFWWFLALGIIGGGYSLYDISDRILNPKEFVTKEEFEKFKKEEPQPILKDCIK